MTWSQFDRVSSRLAIILCCFALLVANAVEWLSSTSANGISASAFALVGLAVVLHFSVKRGAVKGSDRLVVMALYVLMMGAVSLLLKQVHNALIIWP